MFFLNPLCTSGFFLLVRYNKHGMAHSINNEKSHDKKSIPVSEDWFCLGKQCRALGWWNVTWCGISLGSSLFAYVCINESIVYKGLKTKKDNVHISNYMKFENFRQWDRNPPCGYPAGSINILHFQILLDL